MDFADGFFGIGPALVGVDADGLCGKAADGGDGLFVRIETDLDLEDGIEVGFESLLAGALEGVDAKGKAGERGGSGVEAEVAVERQVELLA